MSVTGRYTASKTETYVSPNGVAVTYLQPRMVPSAPRATATTNVAQGEIHRLDLIAHRTLGNPLLAWRIADANGAMDPFELCGTPGATIDVPGPSL